MLRDTGKGVLPVCHSLYTGKQKPKSVELQLSIQAALANVQDWCPLGGQECYTRTRNCCLIAYTVLSLLLYYYYVQMKTNRIRYFMSITWLRLIPNLHTTSSMVGTACRSDEMTNIALHAGATDLPNNGNIATSTYVSIARDSFVRRTAPTPRGYGLDKLPRSKEQVDSTSRHAQFTLL